MREIARKLAPDCPAGSGFSPSNESETSRGERKVSFEKVPGASVHSGNGYGGYRAVPARDDID